MARILAPHKEQDGFHYLRVSTHDDGVRRSVCTFCGNNAFRYNDAADGSRIISSRRVEEAVETADYLKRCKDEKLVVKQDHGPDMDEGNWFVGNHYAFDVPRSEMSQGKTLREAYWRYKNATS